MRSKLDEPSIVQYPTKTTSELLNESTTKTIKLEELTTIYEKSNGYMAPELNENIVYN